jgi:hypothetical protein
LSKSQNQSADVRKRLRELLEYVEELVKQAEKPVFALNDYNNLLYYESDLKGQVGIHHDLEDEDGPIWLKIDRLKRINPPIAPESIRQWLAVGRDPFREPVLETMRVQTMHQEEAAKLVARGLAAGDDIQPTLKTGQPRDHVDVVMRLERFIDVKAAVNQYISGPWREWSEAEKPRRRTIAIYDAFFTLQQALQSDPEHPVEIVWGIGVSRWKLKGIEIDHPLIEQLVDPTSGLMMVKSGFGHVLSSRNSRFGHSSNSTMMVPHKSENSGRTSWPKPWTKGRYRRFELTRLHRSCGRVRPSCIREACIIQIKPATSPIGPCQRHRKTS